MSRRSPTAKSIPALIGGALLVLVAGYFGIDLGGESSTSPTTVSTGAGAGKTASSSKYESCPMDSLPKQADATVDDILAGGPYEFPENDNVRFGNYEGVLPKEKKNYYREYTVETPGLNHRGARRIVTGGGTERDPDVWYYTDDHYESFCQIPDAENTGG